MQDEIDYIVDAVHQAYIQAITNQFWYVARHYIKIVMYGAGNPLGLS
jgi:hypothetical protein